MPSSAPKQTQSGNSYIPNSFQVPNVVADRLAALLPDSAFKVLVVACRKILGYDEHRRTLRDRISLSQFSERGGGARNTIISAVAILEKANILLAIGTPTQDGQEYELNLGQSGDYKWDYLETLTRRSGNRNPAAARNALRAQRLQNEMFPPDVAVMGSLTIRPPEPAQRSNEIDTGSLTIRPEVSISLDTQKPKTILTEIDTSSLDQPVFNTLTPRLLWQRGLAEMEFMVGKSLCDAYLAVLEPVLWANDALTVLAPNKNIHDMVENRLRLALQRTLVGIAGHKLEIVLEIAGGES